MSEEVLEPTGETPTVVQALSLVMADIGAVAKSGVNQQQKFYFRGVDAVVNAASPAFRRRGVVVVPELLEKSRTSSQTKSGSTLNVVEVTVKYTFHGPAGDSVCAVVAAEAFDSGDKATAKAMSVAFRTALLQTLALPTDEADPDEDNYDHVVQTAAPTAGAGQAADAAAAQSQAQEFAAAIQQNWNNPNGLVPLLTWARQVGDNNNASRIQARLTALASQNGAPQ